jgi:hypothetical protein
MDREHALDRRTVWSSAPLLANPSELPGLRAARDHYFKLEIMRCFLQITLNFMALLYIGISRKDLLRLSLARSDSRFAEWMAIVNLGGVDEKSHYPPSNQSISFQPPQQHWQNPVRPR